MLKKSGGSFFLEGALLSCALAFGLYFRFFDLAAQSPWMDELASWFYVRHLDEVFLYESHTPFYYLILKLFAGESASIYGMRFISATISFLHLIAIYLIGSRFMDRKRVIALVILMCFSPADIVYSRMARHYSFVLEGTLLFFLLVRANARTWVCALSAAALSFIHIFTLIPMAVILFFEWLETKNLKKNLLIFFSSLGVILYYALRFVLLDEKRVVSNVKWISMETSDFFYTTVSQFLGDAYPRTLFFPPDPKLAYFLIAGLLLYLLIRRHRSGLIFLTVWVLSMAMVEIVDLFWMNLRVNRYLIYLTSLLPLALVCSIPRLTLKHLIFIFFASGALVSSLHLMTVFPWDKETVAIWKEFTAEKKDVAQLVCTYGGPNDYFDLKSPYFCGERLASVDLKKPLLFLDLDVNNTLVLQYLTSNMTIIDQMIFPRSRIIHFAPKR